MKFKNLPSIIALITGLIVCIISVLDGFTIVQFLWTLVTVIIIFYLFGFILRLLLNRAFREKLETIEEVHENDENDISLEHVKIK